MTAAGVAHLEQLPHLQFLDMRSTGIARAALAPVQRRFALQFVQAAVRHPGKLLCLLPENAMVPYRACPLFAGLK